ncbi:MAG: 4-hydroxythreonine-4-phosphate dehydrogenase PdxA [Ignavibacteria bacterium]|jgi:4-hydroxythreonine-4-phosphate dehydrogenase
MNSFVFTCGDINGIGPEIVIKALNKIASIKVNAKFYFICPINIFESTAANVSPKFEYDVTKSIYEDSSSGIIIVNNSSAKQNLGKSTVSSGRISFSAIYSAYSMLQDKLANAVITAPISKTAINKANVGFSGHTEMFAKWTHSKTYVMTFLSNKIKSALVTIHKPIKEVANSLNKSKLVDIINVLDRTLKIDLDINKPRIAVLGLNPHAGEGGLIGQEEMDIIIPAINGCFPKVSIEGPFPPDAFFARKRYKEFDMILGMYHDQSLIPFKLLNPGKGVNYTAGLPIVRTSPNHGVAYDIAGDFVADESSMIQAYKYAAAIVKNRRKNLGK